MRILVVEDEERISSFVKSGLTEKGFAVEVFDNGEDGLRAALGGAYDVVLLDIMIPGRDGLEILKELRAAGQQVPVILLTARDALDDRVQGLNAGADDYVTKPFYLDEVIARIAAVTRRRAGVPSALHTIGPVTLNKVDREVTVNGAKVVLTSREFSLLEFLMRSAGDVVTRTQLIEKVWEYRVEGQTNIVEVYIQRVRARLAEAGAPDVIETVRGVGYRYRNSDPR